MQPVLTRTPVGIGEDEYLEFRRQLFHGNPQIVYLLAGAARTPRDDHVGFHFRCRSYPLDDAASGIRAQGKYEKNLVSLALEFRERQKIALQARFHAFTGA